MALIDEVGGCKVGWAYYDDEAEAKNRGAVEAAARERKFAQGYDFGYLWPGSVEKIENHPKYRKDVWKVVTT